jgi:hypothetical protein
MSGITGEDVVRAAQAVQRDRRELLGLLSDVSDSVVAQDQAAGAVAHLSPSLIAEIQRRTTRTGEDRA